MKCNTNHPTLSTPIPTGVYDLNTLQTECEIFGIEPTRPNIRRMRRAIDLHQHGAVIPFSAATDYYHVRSQTDQKGRYTVSPLYGCDCPDAERMNDEQAQDAPQAAWDRIHQTHIRCKHEIAVMLYQEQQRDQAMCAEHDALKATSDDSLVHSDPVDFPY